MKHINVAKKYGTRILAGVVLAVPGMVFAQTTSYLPAGVAGHFTQAGSDVTTISGNAWPVIISIAGIFFGIAIFKKFARKAS